LKNPAALVIASSAPKRKEGDLKMPQILGYVVIVAGSETYTSSGVSKVEHLGTGLYHITFDFSVANACEIVSLGHYETAGYVTAYGVPPVGPNVVEVTTFNANVEVQDLTFQLLVVGEDTGSPGATLSSTTLDFGSVSVDDAQASTKGVTLTNTGSASLVITGISISGDASFTLYSQNCEGATLAPGESCTVTVEFTPPGIGFFHATLTFTDNASTSPQQVVLKATILPSKN
jgi:archaellum component FlaF (FlaF/FlaG flagellin family)